MGGGISGKVQRGNKNLSNERVNGKAATLKVVNPLISITLELVTDIRFGRG